MIPTAATTLIHFICRNADHVAVWGKYRTVIPPVNVLHRLEAVEKDIGAGAKTAGLLHTIAEDAV